MNRERLGMGEGLSAEVKPVQAARAGEPVPAERQAPRLPAAGLLSGGNYWFTHRRKGVFLAEFLRSIEGDQADPVLWHVRIPTGPGSGQERFTNSFIRDAQGRKVPPEFEDKHIRPSLVERVEEARADGRT